MGPRLGRFRLKSFTFFRLATEIGPARSHLVKCHLTKCLTFPRFVNGKPVNIPGHSVPLAGLGGFILVFGFLAFNGGSQVSTLGLTLIATNSCEGQHISRWRRWHCCLGNCEHNLGRFDRGHCCAPPYQVQVDCQELCKNFNLYSLPKKCKRISTHYLTWKALFSSNCFLQFLKQKAERGKWSFLLTLNGALAGMVSFLLILIGSFLSFHQIHVRSLH